MNEQKINLLIDTKGSGYAKLLTKLRVLRAIAIGFLFFVGASSMMLFLMIAFSPLPRLKQEEGRLTQSITSGENQQKMDKYFIISSRLKDINMLLAQRPDIVKTYEIIERTLTGSVRVNFIDITDKTVGLNLQSRSLGDLEAVVKNLKNIPEKPYQAVTLSGITYNVSNNTYDMTIAISQ